MYKNIFCLFASSLLLLSCMGNSTSPLNEEIDSSHYLNDYVQTEDSLSVLLKNNIVAKDVKSKKGYVLTNPYYAGIECEETKAHFWDDKLQYIMYTTKRTSSDEVQKQYNKFVSYLNAKYGNILKDSTYVEEYKFLGETYHSNNTECYWYNNTIEVHLSAIIDKEENEGYISISILEPKERPQWAIKNR